MFNKLPSMIIIVIVEKKTLWKVGFMMMNGNMDNAKTRLSLSLDGNNAHDKIFR